MFLLYTCTNTVNNILYIKKKLTGHNDLIKRALPASKTLFQCRNDLGRLRNMFKGPVNSPNTILSVTALIVKFKFFHEQKPK